RWNDDSAQSCAGRIEHFRNVEKYKVTANVSIPLESQDSFGAARPTFDAVDCRPRDAADAHLLGRRSANRRNIERRARERQRLCGADGVWWQGWGIRTRH